MIKLYELNNEEVRDEMDKQVEELGQLLRPTGVDSWDRLFGGLYLGAVSAVVSTTGGGKSKFLRAMAKQLSRKYNGTVLYITIEQSPLQASKKFNREDPILMAYMEDLTQWTDIEQMIKQYNIQFIMYDYLGALISDGDSEWQALRDDVARLNSIAKAHHVAIMTAMQATFELLDLKDSRDAIRNTKYVAYSKNTVNNLTQAAYLINKPQSVPVLATLKNREGEVIIETPVAGLDYGTEEFVKVGFGLCPRK